MTHLEGRSGYWSDFPMTYRQEQVATIGRWVSGGESGVVLGGSGTGKSNLVGFLGSRIDAIAPHLADTPDNYCFLSLDVNSLPALTIPYFYRGFIQALLDASEMCDADAQQAMQQLTGPGRVDWDDAFSVMNILQKVHRQVIRQAGKKVVWLLDRFDEAYRRLSPQTLNTLRYMRDQFKGRLSYVAFTRYPLARLRDPGEVDELHEILAANVCPLGPMVDRDVRWLAQQMGERLETTFTGPAITKMAAVTGGLPAFLKATCLALAEGALATGQPAENWVNLLLARPEIQRSCREIWDDLLVEEQKLLISLSTENRRSMPEPGLVSHLTRTGLLVPSPVANAGGEAPDLAIFSPIFKAFIIRRVQTAGRQIELDPKTGEVQRDGIPLDVSLSRNEHRLLSYFLSRAGEICEKDDLIGAVWPDDRFQVRDDRLAQLVKRLRHKIEPDPANPLYIQTVRGRGYRFVQPG